MPLAPCCDRMLAAFRHGFRQLDHLGGISMQLEDLSGDCHIVLASAIGDQASAA
jgi:hypothetical protein